MICETPVRRQVPDAIYKDVEPEVLAEEDAAWRRSGRAWWSSRRPSVPRLPDPLAVPADLEGAPTRMAHFLLSVGRTGARRYAAALHGSARAADDTRRAKFWGDVLIVLADMARR